MTTVPVRNTGSLLPVAEVKKQIPSEDNSFADVLKQSAGKPETESPQPSRSEEPVNKEPVNKEPVKTERQKTQLKEEKQTVPDKKDELTSEQVQSAMETLSTIAEAVVEDLAQMFEMEPEQVIEVMDELGLARNELFEPENLQNLFMTLAKEPDEGFLLTSDEPAADFNGLLAKVKDSVEQAAGEFGLTGEELLEKVRESLQVKQENPQNLMLARQNPKTETYTVNVPANGEQITMEMSKEEESSVVRTTDALVSTEATPEQKQTGQTEQENGKNQNKENDSTGHAASFSTSFSEQINTVKQSQMDFQDVLPSFTAEQTSDIMDQIVERMRVDQTEGLTKLQMQLRPEHLGRVTIEITSRNGEMTAQITTQNEQVRAAVEAQLTQLKENLSDQGLKVESVEVMVETHSFEQSFEGQEHPGQESGAGTKKNRTHRIRLDEIDLEGDDTLTDEERIVAELMADRGGTVDYAV